MPLYEYECTGCHHRFETLQPMGASAEGLDCPSCGGDRLERQLSSFATTTVTREAPTGGCGATDCCQGACFADN